MKVLVIGRGFIGQAVRAELDVRGHDVTLAAAPRLATKARTSKALRVEARTEARGLEIPGLDAVDVVINCAGLASPRVAMSDELIGANALLPAVLAEAIRISGNPCRLIHISSAAVQGDGVIDESARVAPFSPYSLSKSIGEECLRGLENVTVFRPTSVHGPGRELTASLTRFARSRLASVAGRGDQPSPVVWIDDVADAVAFLVEHPAGPPIVLQPNAGNTCASVLRRLGDKEPTHIPLGIVRLVVAVLKLVDHIVPRLRPTRRRLEVLWFGQQQESGWLERQGWTPKASVDLSNAVDRRTRVLFVYTVEPSLRTAVFGQIEYLSARGFDVHAVCADDDFARSWVEAQGGTFHPIALRRSPKALIADLLALRALVRLMRSIRPDLVVSGSPKAGLLGSLSARRLGIPSIYALQGLRLEGAAGTGRGLLVLLERLTCSTAGRVVAVGGQLREAAIAAGVVRAERVDIVGRGSANGVDVVRFAGNTPRPVRAPGDVTFGFVGRITPDKGIADLIEAWPLVVRASGGRAKLVVVGAPDRQDPADHALAQGLVDVGADCHGWVADPAPHIAEMDVLVLPSRREGLPTVVLEAGAAGVPAVMTDCTGARDCVKDGVTGVIVPMGDADQLASAMTSMLADGRREAMGIAAAQFVSTNFDRNIVWSSYEAYYRSALGLPNVESPEPGRRASDGVESP